MSLEERLKEAIDIWQEECDHTLHMDDTIADIIQAFKDEHWIDPFTILQAALGAAPVPTEDRYGIDENGKLFGPTKELMTGQEFYDRFVVEMNERGMDLWSEEHIIKEAAKKAAGI